MGEWHLPFVQLLDCSSLHSGEYPNEVRKGSLPDTEFKLVEKVRDEHGVEVETEIGEGVQEGILK
jgi:hypothetical protein